jgi:hypothetical protein
MLRRFVIAALLVLLVGCQSAVVPSPPELGTPLPFPRASIEPDDVARAIEMEQELSAHAGTLPRPDEAWFEFRPGTSSVMFTAPHATQPTRDGKLRFADTGTGSLARMLNETACASVLYTTRASPADPNRTDDNAFKQELERRLRETRPVLVVDLHGSDPNRPYDIDFGTIGGRSLRGRADLLDALVASLRADGLEVFSAGRFDAAGKTVTRWVYERSIPAVQLEISSTWLMHAPLEPAENAATPREPDAVLGQRFARLLEGLTRFAAAVDREEARPPCERPEPN